MEQRAQILCVAPASGGCNAASRRIVLARQSQPEVRQLWAAVGCSKFQAGRLKSPAGRGCYP